MITALAKRAGVRFLIPRDIPAVLAIERATDCPDQWTDESLRHAHACRRVHIHVVVADNRIVGFSACELEPSCIRLVQLAVHPEARRLGFGTRLIANLAGKLSPGRWDYLTTMVRDTNLPGQLFLRGTGWYATQVLREHFGGGCDGYRFIRETQ